MKAMIPKRFLSGRLLALGEKRLASILRRTETLAVAFDAQTKNLSAELRELDHMKIKSRSDLETAKTKLYKLIDTKQKLRRQIVRVVANARQHFEEFAPLDRHRHSSENRIEVLFHNAHTQLESLHSKIQTLQNDLYIAQHRINEKERNELTWGE